MIAIIDYGMGNLRSVEKALQVSGAKTKVTSSPKDIERCDKIVFPGVGAFGGAMRELKRRGLDAAIKSSISDGKLFLGLCLGLQLLFERSEEAPGVKGLGVLKGPVRKFSFKKYALKVPHMGWNSIGHRQKTKGRSLMKDIPDGSYMYFVHSYYADPEDREAVLTTTDYGIKFVSGVAKDNVFGLQFHPEKSQDMGLKILSNFVAF